MRSSSPNQLTDQPVQPVTSHLNDTAEALVKAAADLYLSFCSACGGLYIEGTLEYIAACGLIAA